ncbi:MAG: DUF2628 domain-containing protein [Hyphomicrobiales bacterium]
MHSYTVHLSDREASREEQLSKAVFVRDGFHLVAFIIPPLWLLWHRQWLGLLMYAAVLVIFDFGTDFVSGWALGIANFLIGLGIALEASTLRRWRLQARGWQLADAFAAHDLEDAEQRFFERLKDSRKAAPLETKPTRFSSTPIITPSSTVIGYQS